MPNFWQFSKFNNFLWVYWFLGKNLSNFVPPACKLHNLYCHTFHPPPAYQCPLLTNSVHRVINIFLELYMLHILFEYSSSTFLSSCQTPPRIAPSLLGRCCSNSLRRFHLLLSQDECTVVFLAEHAEVKCQPFCCKTSIYLFI